MASPSNDLSYESLKDCIPAYLTDGKQAAFLRSIVDKYPNIDYYAPRKAQEILQGDGWKGLEIVTFEDQAKISVSGIILSNTCDISSDNSRLVKPNIIFSIAVSTSHYQQWLRAESGNEDKITSHMEAIYAQAVTNRFFFPKAPNMNDSYIALLDQVHTIPRDYYLKCPDRKACICLSNSGFYVFIVKLSVHFCRLADNVNRNTLST